MSHPYTVTLEEIAPGRPFMMVNYHGIYIRVDSDKEYKLKRPAAMGEIEHPFNGDGQHIPVVELLTGRLFYMAKIKPCMVYPGEDHRSRARIQ
jgi:hypothetical protein